MPSALVHTAGALCAWTIVIPGIARIGIDEAGNSRCRDWCFEDLTVLAAVRHLRPQCRTGEKPGPAPSTFVKPYTVNIGSVPHFRGAVEGIWAKDVADRTLCCTTLLTATGVRATRETLIAKRHLVTPKPATRDFASPPPLSKCATRDTRRLIRQPAGVRTNSSS